MTITKKEWVQNGENIQKRCEICNHITMLTKINFGYKKEKGKNNLELCDDCLEMLKNDIQEFLK